jgi:argininosuccinate synthase
VQEEQQMEECPDQAEEQPAEQLLIIEERQEIAEGMVFCIQKVNIQFFKKF